jgi:hypothetical protein
MAFDLLIRGGLLIDGSGAAARPADVGVSGDRIAAIGDLSAVPDIDVPTVVDATGHVVSPGFVDPHGHSDGSVLLDGALVSHLRQGFTTQLSGNCGYTFAPMAAPSARCSTPTSRTSGSIRTDHVRRLPGRGRAAADGPNVALLVGHGTVRWAAMAPTAARRRRSSWRRWAATSRRRWTPAPSGVERADLCAGRARRADEVAALVAVAARPARSTPPTCATSRRACSAR